MMSLSEMASYFVTLIAIALAPGPVALVLLVRSASQDIQGAVGFGIGYALGGLLIISAICFGMGAWLTAVPAIFEYGKYLMMAYILWVAYGILKGGFDLTRDCQTRGRSFPTAICAGVMTCFISPYMMILFPLVLPSLMDITSIQLPQFLVVGALTFLALFIGAGVIILFAAQISRIARSERSMATLNKALASVLVIGGSWIAFA